MSDNKYKAIHKALKTIDFELLVLEIPEEEIEDKLAYLAREKGRIMKSFYEDYIIATCVANINQFLFHINQNPMEPNALIKLREEVMAVIIEVNPVLNPEKISINRNYVLKIRLNHKGDLPEGDKWLVDNKSWSTSYYDELQDIYDDEDGPEESLTDEEKTGKKAPPPPPNKRNKPGNKNDKQAGKLKDINELEYEVVNRWWKRLGKYISIRKYNKADAESILKQRYFHNRTSFGTFVVSQCVENFEELFQLLDNLGIPGRIAPPILMHELYELCKSVNEFLTYENAQELVDESLKDTEDEEESCARTKSGKANGMSQYIKNKSKKRFKDVPKEDLLNLADNMKVFLIGQNDAVDTMVDAIQRASVGLKDPNKPIGSFLFAGKTGVGKTLATKVLADELIRDKNNLITIDCSEYSSDHEYSKLIGAPAGYVGHEAGGLLTNSIAKTPFSVVVFDEVEKASYKVHELLLQILEEGRLTDGKGKTVSFKDAIVVMTSNIGVKEVEDISKTIGFGDVAKVTDDKKNKALDVALKNKFKPEFLNRIDSIVHFRNLTDEDYMRIIDIELYKLNDNLKSNDTEYKGIKLEFDDKIKKLIFKEGVDENYGARPLKRCIEKTISTPLALKLLREDINKESIVKISASKSKPIFKIEIPKEDPPFYVSEDFQNELKSIETGENF